MEYVLLSKNVTAKKVSETSTKGEFVVEGLSPGYNVTLGNLYRRVLLSSLPGAAVTQFKIKGVKHEFSAISGILEDVVDIMLNIKQIRFKMFTNEQQIVTLKKKGDGPVYASDINQNSDIQVINGDLVLAHITDKNAELDMEFVIEKGLGYSPVEDRKNEKLSVGSVAVDALFSPIITVNAINENMRVGERTDYGRLILTIETDGTVTPSHALHKATSIIQDHVEIIGSIESITEVEGEEKSEKKSKPKK